MRFYTIGHSTRSVEGLVDLLRQAGANMVVDVRSIPRSRATPQFNADVLPPALARAGIEYRHIAVLGGRRGRQRGAEPSRNQFWQNQSFRNYADYSATPAFRAGLAELRYLGESHACAVMCAEALWWRCHRRIIADYLLAAGETVWHIMSPFHLVPAQLTPGAVACADGTLAYPGSA